MSTLLKLRITADWPASRPSLSWALYELGGKLIEQGESEPAHWPPADHCELILSADQCLLLDARLPQPARGRRHDDAKVIAYAVEDRVIGDIHNEHVVAAAADESGQTAVWLIARARLAAVLAALAQLGRVPRRAFCELELAPAAAGCWTACVSKGEGFLRTSAHGGFSFAAENAAPPAELALALAGAGAEGAMPARLAVYCAPEACLDAQAWHAELGIPVEQAGDYVWHREPAHPLTNLLVGDFSPPRSRHTAWAPFKPALALAAAMLALYALFSLAEWAWLSQRAAGLRAETAAAFRASFPQVPTVVDPALQMHRLYDPLMRERGRLGESDFLPLLASVSEALGAEGNFRSLAFEEGRLQFTVALQDAQAAERLRASLARRGLSLVEREKRPTRAGIETSFSVRFGP